MYVNVCMNVLVLLHTTYIHTCGYVDKLTTRYDSTGTSMYVCMYVYVYVHILNINVV